jgi:hypothetical protein
MKSNEVAGIGNWNTAEFWEYNTRTGRRANMDPEFRTSRNFSPYCVLGGNPILLTDPRGDKEYSSMRAYRKATNQKVLGEGDWLKSDRKKNSKQWNSANSHNLNQRDGFKEYTNIGQRAAFYSWFQETNSRGTRWAGAAAKVAFAINEMANPSMFNINVTGMADGLNYSNADARTFANNGNRMIFEDAFPKLNAISHGPQLNASQARSSDALMLSQEQNLIQPLYNSSPAFGIVSASSKQLLAGSSALAWWKNISIPPFPSNGNLMDVKQRWGYGMQGMGYKVSNSDMPPPGESYTNGTLYYQFRKSGAGGNW